MLLKAMMSVLQMVVQRHVVSTMAAPVGVPHRGDPPTNITLAAIRQMLTPRSAILVIPMRMRPMRLTRKLTEADVGIAEAPARVKKSASSPEVDHCNVVVAMSEKNCMHKPLHQEPLTLVILYFEPI